MTPKTDPADTPPAEKPPPHRAAPELKRLLVAIDSVRPFDGNARRGDVAAIAESLSANGQYKPLIARRETGEVLVGNHTLQAARDLGWTKIAVQFISVPSDAHARRIVLADNRTADLGAYDERALADLLQMTSDDLGDLMGTGYDQASFKELLDGFDATAPPGGPEFPNPETNMETHYQCPACAYEWSGLPKPNAGGDGEPGGGEDA